MQSIYTCVSHCYGFAAVLTDRQAQREDQGDLGVAGARLLPLRAPVRPDPRRHRRGRR